MLQKYKVMLPAALQAGVTSINGKVLWQRRQIKLNQDYLAGNGVGPIFEPFHQLRLILPSSQA